MILAFIYKKFEIDKLTFKKLLDLIPEEFNLRKLLIKQVQQYNNLKISNLLLLIVFNEKTSFLNEFYKKIVNIGIVHLVVISGLHLNLINTLILKIFKKYLRISQILSLFIILIYSYFLNFSFGVIRVVISIFIGAFFCKKQSNKDLLTTTSLSGLITLCLNPHSIFNLNFQLSYLSIFAICFANKIPYINKWLIGFVSSFLINMLIGPVILSMNSKISLLTIFNSWILSPIIMFYYIFSLLIFWLPFTWNFFSFIYDFLFFLINNLNEIQIFLFLDIKKINSILIYIYYLFFLLSFIFLNVNEKVTHKNLKYIK
ncbi:ComEC/Rec2 family competence protein [Mycoplasmoides pirum]|uniref:ComEC/Rec2 family competence protein n=1 Tax=Mycoplasmoides pirum TaxID=2122 RepID=UPI0004862271|nr:ComEC/Rec2 family competence protein [Mycoplasmoides pirum]